MKKELTFSSGLKTFIVTYKQIISGKLTTFEPLICKEVRFHRCPKNTEMYHVEGLDAPLTAFHLIEYIEYS